MTPKQKEALEAVKKYGGVKQAARALGVSYSSFRSRLLEAQKLELLSKVPPDQLVERRLRDQVASLARQRDEAVRRAVAAEDIRAAVFGLVDPPPAPVSFSETEHHDKKGETVIAVLSDLHWGERVDIAAMDGLNAYDTNIARARLARAFNGIASLSTEHWSGPPPERLIVILGGDLISGDLHELPKTNDAKSIPAVRDLVPHLVAGFDLLKERLDCPIDIISLAGNHGRTTFKPESKEAAINSYDTLVSDFIEMHYKNDPRVTVFVPASVDALFSVYGYRFLATHGDRIGSRGGAGHIGPAATAARGFKRIVADYAARGVLLDTILICHFHTPLQLEEGYVNGSLVGPSEYSRDGRFRPHPAQQLYLSVHPRRGVTQARWIKVGVPEEGSLYEPPPSDRPLRPRYRVPAISVKV
jgi:hypothetical protein